MVHNRHNGVVAAVFQYVRDEVDADFIPQGIWDWQRLVQSNQFMCMGLIAQTNVAALTVPIYIITHVWQIALLGNHCISAVHPSLAMCILELVQYYGHQSLWYKQTSFMGQKIAQTIF